MSFENLKHNQISYYSESEIYNSGFIHGFCDACLDFRKEQREESSAVFCKAFEIEKLFLLEQEHTPDFVLISDANIENYKTEIADAFIIKKEEKINKLAFGILTADCIPLIFKSGNVAAVVHSGWRGLANGIIKSVISKIQELTTTEPLYALIGPCAGKASYEVGQEVIDQIGDEAVYKSSAKGKHLLSLTETAVKIIENSHLDVKTSTCDICVIKNTGFSSYRRQSEDAGRNLTFVIF